ncbi:MAG: RNA polymerase sigma factor [Pirellulales bacterium]
MREDDRAEIAATFRDCHADLVSYFARQHVDTESAADLAAESVLQLLRRMGEGTRPDVLRAYLFGIARRVGLAARRKRIREPTLVDGAALSCIESTPADDAVAVARELLQGLPPRHQEVLDLRFVAGLSYAEIAVRLGIPLGTVRSRIHHAVALLRARVETD